MSLFQQLKLNPKNPRKIDRQSLERLKASIKGFPEMLEKRPIVYDENFIVLGGNSRLMALRELLQEGFDIKDTYFLSAAGWPLEKKREFVIRDNVFDGQWDTEILQSDWADLPLEEWGVDVEGWSNEEPEIVEDEAPALVDTPVSQTGSVYQLGKHRLMCGDSTMVDQIEKLMGGSKADMVFTDPPYNVNYGNTMKDKLRHKASKSPARTILNDNFETNEDFYQFLYDSISAFRPFVSGDVYIAMSSSELHTLQKAFIDCDGHWSTFIIWVKNHFTLGRSNYQRQYEPILYGWFEGSSHYWSGIRKLGDVIKQEDAFVDSAGDVYIKAEGIPTDIWEVSRPSRSVEHPTMKPIALCARAIQNSSKQENVVLDVFGGSGSTLIACEQLNRLCYMMEMDPRYCDVIRKRYHIFTTGSEEGWEDATAT